MWIERIKSAAVISLVFIALEAIAFLVIFSTPSVAHEASPAVIEVTQLPEQQVIVQIRMEPRAFLARLEGVDHDAYNDLSIGEASARLLETPSDALTSAFQFGEAGGGKTIAAKGAQDPGLWDLMVFEASIADLRFAPSQAIGDAVVRILDPVSGAPVQSFFVRQGETVLLANPESETPRNIVAKYLRSGFDHILPKGLDHILFVVGLFLLSPALRPLLTQVSLFTVAHTATLGLAATGIVSVPAIVVEPLIAASIAFIAVENLFRTSLSRWRPWVVFGNPNSARTLAKPRP